MGMYSGYAKKLKEKKEFEKKQEELHAKHKAIEKDKVIVEKSNTIKFLIKTLIAIIKTSSAILLIFFAGIGIMTMIYPELRDNYFALMDNIVKEAMKLIGV